MDCCGFVLESIFSLSNGLLGIRGSFEEPMLGTPSRPLTCMAGLYDTLPKGSRNCLRCPTAWPPGSRWARPPSIFVAANQELCSLAGYEAGPCWFAPELEVQAAGPRADLMRFVSLADRNLMAVGSGITPIDWSGRCGGSRHQAPATPVSGGASHWERPTLDAMRTASRHWRPAPGRPDDRWRSRPLYEQQSRDRLAGAPSSTRIWPACLCLDVEQDRTYIFDRFITMAAEKAMPIRRTRRVRQAATAARKSGWAARLDAHTAPVRACGTSRTSRSKGRGGSAGHSYNLFQLATLCRSRANLRASAPRDSAHPLQRARVLDTEVTCCVLLVDGIPPGPAC